jgi:hypothetical protein
VVAPELPRDPHERPDAEVLAALLHAGEVLNRRPELLGERGLRPTLRRAQLGDPPADVAYDLVGASGTHLNVRRRIGRADKTSDLM